MARATLPIGPRRGRVMHCVAEPRQVGDLFVGHDDHVTAPTTVAPVRTALGHTRLSAEREPTLAPVPTFDVDARPVGKRHGGSAYAEAATSG